MKIIFTKHATQRLIERKIPKKDIEKTIKFPDKIYPSFNNKKVAQKKILRNKTIEVIYTKKQNKIIIITCYWL